MIKVLFATGNPSKAKRFSKGLKEKGIEVITLNDIDTKIDINYEIDLERGNIRDYSH